MEHKIIDNPFRDFLNSLTTNYNLSFQNHFHPFVGKFIEKMNKEELADFLSTETQRLTADKPSYNLNNSKVEVDFFKKKVDFSVEGAYSIYNWELFYHIPLSIADQLSKNQRFAEAQKWYHFIFDPTTDEDSSGGEISTVRYWKFLHFKENTNARLITELLEHLTLSDDELKSKIRDESQGLNESEIQQKIEQEQKEE